MRNVRVPPAARATRTFEPCSSPGNPWNRLPASSCERCVSHSQPHSSTNFQKSCSETPPPARDFWWSEFLEDFGIALLLNLVQNLADTCRRGRKGPKSNHQSLKIMPYLLHAPAASPPPPPLARVIPAARGNSKKEIPKPPLVTVSIAPECLHSTSSPTLRLPSPPASISPV
jgi:hypothetical protein